MAEPIELTANDLAAMLCSRVCHDLINPVSAINNGLQAIDDPAQAEMADFAKQMVANAAAQAQAKLEYARLAFGASSTAGTEFETRECERVAQILFAVEKPDLEWRVPPMLLPKNKAKLFMNMLLITIGSVPRGGQIIAEIEGERDHEVFRLTATSDPEKKQRTLMPMSVEEMLSGSPEEGVDARGIQPFYTGILARLTGMKLEVKLEDGVFAFTAAVQPAQSDDASSES